MKLIAVHIFSKTNRGKNLIVQEIFLSNSLNLLGQCRGSPPHLFPATFNPLSPHCPWGVIPLLFPQKITIFPFSLHHAKGPTGMSNITVQHIFPCLLHCATCRVSHIRFFQLFAMKGIEANQSLIR